MAARIEVVHLPHLDGEGADVAASVQRRAEHYGDLVRFASQLEPGHVRAVPVPCRQRPARKACGGLLVVARQAAEDHLEWQCPSCGAGGVITGWQGTKADLRAMRPGPRQEVLEVAVPVDALNALRGIAREDRELGRLAFTAEVHAEGHAVLLVRDSEAGYIVTRLTMEAMRTTSRRTIGRLMGIVAAIAEAANGGAALAGLDLGDDDLDDIDDEDIEDDDLDDEDPTAVFEMLEQIVNASAARSGPQPVRGRSERKPAKRKRTRSALTLQIKVTLRDVRPPIWRRLLVPADILLPRLHDVLQVAMGWHDAHLHLFRQKDVCYAPPGDWDPLGEDSTDVTLADLADRKGARLVYEYDFGDGWTHDILVEQVLHEPCEELRCIGGRRRCPPEDCGGPWGFGEFLEAIADPEHESHDDMLEWCGGGFDPEAFDVDEVDAALRRLIVE